MPLPRAIILMGLPAAGKTTYALSGRFPGFIYISPDLFPGRRRNFQKNKVRNMIFSAIYNQSDFIVDDCNPSCSDRKFYLDVFKHSLGYNTLQPGRTPYIKECHHLRTTMKQAKNNASMRRIKGGDRISRVDLITCTQQMKNPSKAEGFNSIVNVDFERQVQIADNKAIFFSLDGVFRPLAGGSTSLFSQKPKQVMISPNRNHVFRRYHDEGYKLIGITYLSDVASGRISEAVAQACILEIVRQLKVPIDEVFYCPHREDAQCHCLPPSTYFAKLASSKHRINLKKSIMVGSGSNSMDKVFAERANIGSYVGAVDFYNQENLIKLR